MSRYKVVWLLVTWATINCSKTLTREIITPNNLLGGGGWIVNLRSQLTQELSTHFNCRNSVTFKSTVTHTIILTAHGQRSVSVTTVTVSCKEVSLLRLHYYHANCWGLRARALSLLRTSFIHSNRLSLLQIPCLQIGRFTLQYKIGGFMCLCVCVKLIHIFYGIIIR